MAESMNPTQAQALQLAINNKCRQCVRRNGQPTTPEERINDCRKSDCSLFMHRPRIAPSFVEQADDDPDGTIHVFTDGSCLGNPGPGGWGFVVVNPSTGEPLLERSGGEEETTNNRMELVACIRALQALGIQGRPIRITTDSSYVQKGITQWVLDWKERNWCGSNRKPVKNQDLWQVLDALNLALEVEWHWIKGHSGDAGNEAADAAAHSAALRIQQEQTLCR